MKVTNCGYFVVNQSKSKYFISSRYVKKHTTWNIQHGIHKATSYDLEKKLQQTFRFYIKPFRNDKFLDSSKLKEFEDDNFKFDENGRKFFKRVENVTSNFSLSHSVFKRLILQTRKNQGLFGKGLREFVS